METNLQREKLECKITETFSDLLLLKEKNKQEKQKPRRATIDTVWPGLKP